MFDVSVVQIIKAHISATTSRFMESAEQMELKKMYHDGTLREICLSDIRNYKNSGMLLIRFTIFTGRMLRSGKLPVLNLLTGKKSGFLPAGATRCTDSRQTWQGRRARGSAWLCKISPQSPQWSGNAAPKYQSDSLDDFENF